MKNNDSKLNKIYGDLSILAMNNRIKFIESKKNKFPLTIDLSPSQFYLEQSKQRSIKYEKLSLKTQSRQEKGKNDSKISKYQKLIQLKSLKSQRYKQCKENSQHLMAKLCEQKSKQIDLKRIKRRDVLISEQIARYKLSTYQQQKLKRTKIEISSRQFLKSNVEFKKLQLKRQLIQQQQKSLQNYQSALSYKSELMRKIQNLIQPQN